MLPAAIVLGQHREDCLPAVLRVPAPVSRQRLDDLQSSTLLSICRRSAPVRAVGGGVRDDDGYCRRIPGARERYPDRLGAVAGDVLHRVGDELGRDDRGVVRIIVQSVEAERGPDMQARDPH